MDKRIEQALNERGYPNGEKERETNIKLLL
jgi:hypothetical protein